MKYHFFLDETGDHGLSFIDENFPIFLLCGCLLRQDELAELEERINKLKAHFFGSTAVILHSRDIRKCEGAFQVLFDLDLKKQFYEALNELIEQTGFVIIGSAVDKSEHIKRYGKGAKDPYSLALSFVLERLVFCLDGLAREGRVIIEAEKRGAKEDNMLLAHYNSINDRGTYYVGHDRFTARIEEFNFRLCALTITEHAISSLLDTHSQHN